jgi:hypothetical protein
MGFVKHYFDKKKVLAFLLNLSLGRNNDASSLPQAWTARP